MHIIHQAGRAALRIAPFALLFAALRRSNRQHGQRAAWLYQAVTRQAAEVAGQREHLKGIVAAVAGTSEGLCDVRMRLDRALRGFVEG